MTQDYVLDHISMDNPDLARYIRDIHLKLTTRQEPLNATDQTPEELFVFNQLQAKRDGIYIEYISRVRDFFILFTYFFYIVLNSILLNKIKKKKKKSFI